VILLVAFLIIERRQRTAEPFSIFRLRTCGGANLVGLLARHVAVLDVLLHLLYGPERLHYSPIKRESRTCR